MAISQITAVLPRNPQEVWNVVTSSQPCNRWEFDMENSNIKGHWIGIFTEKDDQTQITFTEDVTAKKFIMKPFVKIFLKKQQEQYLTDLKKALSR